MAHAVNLDRPTHSSKRTEQIKHGLNHDDDEFWAKTERYFTFSYFSLIVLQIFIVKSQYNVRLVNESFSFNVIIPNCVISSTYVHTPCIQKEKREQKKTVRVTTFSMPFFVSAYPIGQKKAYFVGVMETSENILRSVI
jgi:hypothetical protein